MILTDRSCRILVLDITVESAERDGEGRERWTIR